MIFCCCLVIRLCLTLLRLHGLVAYKDTRSIGFSQARILEWVAISFSRGSSRPWELNLGLQHCRQILHPLSHQAQAQALWYQRQGLPRFWPGPTVNLTETRFATGASLVLGSGSPAPPAVLGSAVADPHGSLAASAPWPVSWTAVPACPSLWWVWGGWR